MDATKRSTGSVKWFSARKGFGFISPDDGDEDLFVHQSSIRSDGFRTLFEGQQVEFSVDLGEDGRTKASDVVSVSGSRAAASRARGGFYRGGTRGSGGGYGGGRRSVRGVRGGGRSGGDGSAYSNSFSGGYGDGMCYNCGRYGHLARDCYQFRGAGGGGGGGSRKYGGGGCYNCGEEGHFARDCPNGDQI